MSDGATSLQLASLIGADSWEAAELPDGQGTARWCPIVEFGELTNALGIMQTGKWSWAAWQDDRWRLFSLDSDAVIGALPLLEIPLGELESKVRKSATRLGLPVQQVVDELPITTIIEAALRTRSNYWIGLAVEWLKDTGPAPRSLDMLKKTASDTSIDQSLRHRLWHLLTG
jgi:hypothetical protein